MKVVWLLTIAMFLCGHTVNAQTSENVLEIGDFEGGISKTIYVPVYLNNTEEVVAAQFDIQLPFAAPEDGTAMLTLRANQHSVSYSSLGSNAYRVVIMTFQNQAFRGNSGLLLRIPMIPVDDGHTSTPYPITISNLVLTDHLGNNIATVASAEGTFTVNRDDLPDLTVTDITPQEMQYAPGDVFTVNYNVKNIGTGDTKAGWTEKIYLESVNGTRTYLGSQAYMQSQAASSTLARSFSTTLPTVLHIDGDACVIVEIEVNANTGELMSDQGNNTGTSDAVITLSKRLYLTSDGNTIREGEYYGYVTATLTRSGDWSVAETFTISCSVENLLTCNGQTHPCTITIPARSSGAVLRFAAVDDKIVRARQSDITVTSTTGYESVVLHLNRIDNDRNPLSIQLVPTAMEEGGTLTLTATRGGELTDDLTFMVNCSHGSRFDQPFKLHFLPGQSSVSVSATAIDDITPQLDATVKFTASVTDYQTAMASMTLVDNDRPTLTMSLSAPSIVENISTNVDVQPLTAIIRRDRGLDQDAVVWLSSSRGEVFFDNQIVTIPAGSEAIEVPVHMTDNSAVDGQRTAMLTAALYVKADRQTAPIGDRACAQQLLTIIDDETPYLTLSTNVSAVGEGSSCTLTVRRYVSDVSSPLSVMLSCDDPRISFSQQPVTIPAGSYKTTVTLNVVRNSIEGDDADVQVKASATGVSDGLMKIHVTDRTLPDAVNPSIACTGAPYYSGLTANVRATIRNCGTSVLAKGMSINFYLCSTDGLYYYNTHSYNFFKGTTNEEVAVGGEKTFEFEAQLPQMVGKYWIYARLNEDKKIAEFNTSNNLTQNFCPITIEAPFEVETIVASPEDCLPGGVINVKGRMKAVEGSQLNRQTVRVSLVGTGQSTTADTQIDALGNFEVNVKVDRSACGFMTVKALALGQTEPAKTTRVHVYNMSLTGSSHWDVDENIATNGTLKLHNTSVKNITVTSFTVTQPLPDGADIVFDTSSLINKTIAGGTSVTIPYTVKGTTPSASRQSFSVKVKTQEGLEVVMPISFFCHATSAYLVFTPHELKTTMLFNADRDDIVVTVKNCGKKATGKIEELITKNWVMSDFGNNRSLEPGESATIRLKLLAQADMHADRKYLNLLQLTPENGTAAVLPITVMTTGDEYATFDLCATDVYTKALGDYSHVANASVTVTNARTGSVVMTGTIDDKGHWVTNQMKEGLYNISIKATRHKTVTAQVGVGPGEDRQLTVLLPYKAFLADFVVDQDFLTNTYTMKQFFNVDLMAPQAIVLAHINDDGFGCGSGTMDIKLANVGLRPATNVKLTFPLVAGCTFTLLNDLPTVMMPGDVYNLQVAYTGPEEGRSRLIATLRMHYEFDIKGEILSENDDYQSLVGCASITESPEPPSVVYPEWPDDPDNPDGDDNPYNPYDPDLPYVPDDDDDKPKGGYGGTVLPTYNSFMAIEFDDALSSLRCGQPLHATLRVKNGEKAPLRNLRFEPQVSAENYENFTSLFDYEQGATTGFAADGRFLQLAAQQEGTMTFTLTPQTVAAPNGPQTYYLGGTISYVDSNTGIHNTASLPLFTITVKPTGDVMLTYLIQRHFLADDVQTEAREEAEPAVFSLLARNVGSTDVAQLQLTANLPDVVSNASSNQVAYTSHYAAVDGQAGNYSFADLQLDGLAAGATSAACWIYSSEESGHVRSLPAIIEGVKTTASSDAAIIVGSPRVLYRIVASDRVEALASTTEELGNLEEKILALSQGDTYLINDVDDEEGLPDMVITATGDEAELSIVSASSSITRVNDTFDYLLSVESGDAGWVYGQLHDPTNGLMKLESIVRKSDNRKMCLANFWQTDRTPQSDYTMLQENLLHFVDSLGAAQETYELHFGARTGYPTSLMNVKLLTDDGTEVEHGGITTEPVKTIIVEFTAPVKKFAMSVASLSAHEKAMSLTGIKPVSSNDKCTFILDISSLEEIPGEHVFTIDATKLKKDNAVGMAEINWTERLQGSALITINVAPEAEYGLTNPTTGLLPFGDQEITATPAIGYQFDGWYELGTTKKVLSKEPLLMLDVWKPQTIVAQFSVQQFNVSIETDSSNGAVTGSSSGIYDYGSTIELTVLPNENCTFLGWMINDEMVTENSTITLVIEQNMDIKPVLVRNATINLTLAQGWNWVSNYLSDPLLIEGDGDLIDRLLSQTEELFRDPQFGLVGSISALSPAVAYKIKASDVFEWNHSGYLFDVNVHPVMLEAGWNWLGYPYLESASLGSVIINAEEGDYITAQEGYAEYSDNCWNGTLTTLVPGVGYLYKSATQKSLQFDFTGSTPSARLSSCLAPCTLHIEKVSPHAYPNTMNVTAHVIRDGLELPGDDYVILAYAGDELRGISQFVGSHHYLTVYGDGAENIRFVVESNETGEQYAVDQTLKFCSDVVGSRKQPYAMNIGTVTGIDQTATEWQPVMVYTLEGVLVSRNATKQMLSRLPKGVYVVSGKRVVIR